MGIGAEARGGRQEAGGDKAEGRAEECKRKRREWGGSNGGRGGPKQEGRKVQKRKSGRGVSEMVVVESKCQ